MFLKLPFAVSFSVLYIYLHIYTISLGIVHTILSFNFYSTWFPIFSIERSLILSRDWFNIA